MAVNNNNIIEEFDKGVAKKSKKTIKATKQSETKIETKSDDPKKKVKEDSYLFTLIIVAVVILGVIGIIFGYTKDKISEIKKGGTEVTKGLENQVAALKKELTDVKTKADELEKSTETNKSVVLDLFDKNRKFPTKVNSSEWNVLNSEELSFSVSYPKSWETIKPIIETKSADDGKETKKEEIIYLQPAGKNEFINAITIKSDYADFASLKLEEKVDIFKELDVLDTKDFTHGKMMYFINFDKDNQEVPTILILTDDNIYRATFNILNKKLDNYFEYRKNFEEILSTFILVPLKVADKELEKKEEKKP